MLSQYSVSGNDPVHSDSKPLPEPMLTQFYVAIWHHYATMSWQCFAALEAVIIFAVLSPAEDEHFVKTSFLFQWGTSINFKSAVILVIYLKF